MPSTNALLPSAITASRAVVGARRARIEDDEIEVSIAQSERQRRSHRSGTDDDQIAEHRALIKRYRLQAASTSATDFGAAAVKFSMPVAVTSTSSSMRTPMFQ